jgi:hypothetical protein
MEMIVVGQTLMPSGMPVERLFLITQTGASEAPKQLHASDGTVMYMRFYPGYPDRPDIWEPVGLAKPISAEDDALFGIDRVELNEFMKDA